MSGQEKPTPLDDLMSVCEDIFQRWDKDMRAGKLLIALRGEINNYDPRVDRIRAALRRAAADQEGEGMGEQDGWIKWKGVSCPVAPQTLVEARFPDGSSDIAEADYWSWNSKLAPIIAYRIVEPTSHD